MNIIDFVNKIAIQKRKERYVMEIWDLRTKSEQERDRKAAIQYFTLALCVIAVFYMLCTGTC